MATLVTAESGMHVCMFVPGYTNVCVGLGYADDVDAAVWRVGGDRTNT